MMNRTMPTQAEIDRMVNERVATHPIPKAKAPRRLAEKMGAERAAEWIANRRALDNAPDCCDER